MATYYLSFSYPDGHVEEVEEVFTSLDAAIAYGTNLLNQVGGTEQFKKGSRNHNKAHFEVLKVEGDVRQIVYKSKV